MPRIAYLTSGAGGMYCGSCLHDNTLARALIRLGCDVQLIPTYTPIRTDEEDVSLDRVFYGGINVYLEQKLPIFRRLPNWLDRFLGSQRLLRWATRGNLSTDAAKLGPLTVSMLRGDQGNQRKEARRLARYLADEARPQLILLSNILIAGCLPAIRRGIDAPTLVTLQGDDLFLEGLPERHRRAAIEQIGRLAESIDGYVTHSVFYADFMADYLRLPRDRFHVVPLGIDASDFLAGGPSPAERRGRTIGFLARHCEAKGLHLLVDAFLQLRQRPATADVRLHTAGWLGADDRAYFDQQVARIEKAGHAEAFHYAGVVDRAGKVAFLRSIDVLSAPTVYREPKGLFVFEALASGVPVVQPAHGAFPELLASTGGGRLFTPGDVDQLADALGELLQNEPLRRNLGLEGRSAVRDRHDADAMARAMLDVFNEYLT